jgi:trk system potassium uptake protein TrkH
MDKRIIYYVLGRLVMAETITMLIPFAIALGNWEPSVPGLR